MNLQASPIHWCYHWVYICLTALCPGLPRWAGTRKVKPIWILLEQEPVGGRGISWAICKSAPRSRQITMPAPHHSVFTGRMPFLPPNQQRQSTEGISWVTEKNLTITSVLCFNNRFPGPHRLDSSACQRRASPGISGKGKSTNPK